MFNKTPKLERCYELLQRKVLHKLITGRNYAPHTTLCKKEEKNQLLHLKGRQSTLYSEC